MKAFVEALNLCMQKILWDLSGKIMTAQRFAFANKYFKISKDTTIGTALNLDDSKYARFAKYWTLNNLVTERINDVVHIYREHIVSISIENWYPSKEICFEKVWSQIYLNTFLQNINNRHPITHSHTQITCIKVMKVFTKHMNRSIGKWSASLPGHLIFHTGNI